MGLFLFTAFWYKGRSLKANESTEEQKSLQSTSQAVFKMICNSGRTSVCIHVLANPLHSFC